MKNKDKNISNILSSLFGNDVKIHNFNIADTFNRRLDELSITKHRVCIALDIENKTLDSIINGESKKFDFITIIKLSNFLDIHPHDLVDKYFEQAIETDYKSIEIAKRRSFILANFDLPRLKKSGFIDSINDFEKIEKKIINFFGYDKIFDFGRNKISAALSSTKRKSGKKTLKFWFDAVYKSIEKTPNTYSYDRQGLINYFPSIRENSVNVESGLVVVAQKLFKLGITLIVIPKFGSDLHLRGATFSYKGKPCIALTRYNRFYPTLFFTLIHELFHLLYDWETIKKHNYHINIDKKNSESEIFSEVINSPDIDEDEADEFASEYLFSKSKLEKVVNHINEPLFIKKFAKENLIHPSIIYSFYLRDYGNQNSYAKYSRFFPKEEYQKLLENFNFTDYEEGNKPLKIINKERNFNLNYNKI